MSVEAETETIDGLIFTCQPFAPIAVGKSPGGYALGVRVGAMLAPLLGQFDAVMRAMGKSANQSESMKLMLEFGALAPLIAPLMGELAKPENAKLPAEILAGTSVIVTGDDGEAENVALCTADAVNRVFAGRMFTMIKAMWFAIRVNFQDFFPGDFVKSLAKSPPPAKARRS